MSEDVSRFLSQVKELGERRIEEDEARSRELEEKILQDRKERQARRAGKGSRCPVHFLLFCPPLTVYLPWTMLCSASAPLHSFFLVRASCLLCLVFAN